MKQDMSSENNNLTINIPFKFHDKKFEIISLTQTSKVTFFKSLIKIILMKKVKLKKYNHDVSEITENNIIIKKSTSPTVINNKEYDKLTLKQAGFQDYEEIEVLIKANPQKKILDEDCEICEEKINKKESETKGERNLQPDFSKFSVIRKIIPGDNSCLFNAVNYALNECMTEPQILRQLIAVEIKSNPELYNSAVLEADPLDYCEWIMRDDTWGGGIELSILSKCFCVRIDVIDIQNNTIEMIGDVRL
jgi:hypothetical protein